MNNHRRMRDEVFRKQQWAKRYDPHIASINKLIDQLRKERPDNVPYIDPLYGGTNAKVLFLFQDPGPATNNKSGSGFLSPENNDPSAELFSECLDSCQLTVNSIITWNAYPWHLQAGKKRPTASQLEIGVNVLHRLLILLPKLKVIIKMGRVAEESWARFDSRYPDIIDNYTLLSGLHTSGRGITNGGQHSRAEGIKKNCLAMQKAVSIITKLQ